MCPRDTSPEAWKVFLDGQRRMSPSEKLRRTLSYSDEIRHLALVGIRQQYPHAGEREVFLRFAHRILGNELSQKVYGGRIREGA